MAGCFRKGVLLGCVPYLVEALVSLFVWAAVSTFYWVHSCAIVATEVALGVN
jgi:hypothetical protein